jgi:predicted glycogen debranching enzyme
MTVDLGRAICGDLSAGERREWLVTNGIGGYGCGTVAGVLTRRYHGLLIAALSPPLGRTLLLTKLDETATYDGQDYSLFTNRWADGHVEPGGYRYLERFRLEGTIPVWTFACADALLEKRVWMRQGENTTYVRYNLLRGSQPVKLSLKAIVNCRDHHASTREGDWWMDVQRVENGLRLMSFSGAAPFWLLSAQARVTEQDLWYCDYLLSQELHRGLDARDDNLFAALFEAKLRPGESVTIVATTEPSPQVDGEAAYAGRTAYERRLISQSGHAESPPEVKQLVLAANQFIVHRAAEDDPEGLSVIAGYPWFGEWGRDTFVSLPGLLLATGRQAEAARVLLTYGRLLNQGLLPNQIPLAGKPAVYNSADAALWMFETLRATYEATEDGGLVREFFSPLREAVDWYVRGTRYGIKVDPEDGLLFAGEEGVQLTWMDAKVGDRVVTPRVGKPVEINALWFNALRTLAEFARLLGEPAYELESLSERTRTGFARFWNEAAGYCYDVLDGPDGDDASLRPNQLLAVSLHHSPLTEAQQRAVVHVCALHLLTSHGLRSLAPGDPAYVGRYGGDQAARDAAYHQGTVWAWLIGPFVSATLRVTKDRALAGSCLESLLRQLQGHGLGTISEIFDGDPPHAPRGCIAQAWSVAEALRAWQETAG